MSTRRALVLGGTGMLAGCSAALVAEGWHVVLPSRRFAMVPEPRNEGGAAVWVPADWERPADLAEVARRALRGPADLLVAWVPESVRESVLTAVDPLLMPDAPVVEVQGDVATEPALSDHPTHRVVLGVVAYAGRTRWLTDAEITEAVLGAVHRGLEHRAPSIHQVGGHPLRVG